MPTTPLHLALTLAVFALTLTLIFVRPRGLHEAWATVLGGGLVLRLLSISVLHQSHAGAPALYGALLGCSIGPNLTPAGSLATMLVITTARKKGEEMSAAPFARAGLWATSAVLLAAWLLLWVTLRVLP